MKEIACVIADTTSLCKDKENERSRCLQSYVSNQDTEHVKDTKGRDGTASSKTSELQLGSFDDLISSSGERELFLSRSFYSPSISD